MYMHTSFVLHAAYVRVFVERSHCGAIIVLPYAGARVGPVRRYWIGPVQSPWIGTVRARELVDGGRSLCGSAHHPVSSRRFPLPLLHDLSERQPPASLLPALVCTALICVPTILSCRRLSRRRVRGREVACCCLHIVVAITGRHPPAPPISALFSVHLLSAQLSSRSVRGRESLDQAARCSVYVVVAATGRVVQG